MNDGAKISLTYKDLLHRSPVVKRVGQRRAAIDQSATSPTGFGHHMKMMMEWIFNHDINFIQGGRVWARRGRHACRARGGFHEQSEYCCFSTIQTDQHQHVRLP